MASKRVNKWRKHHDEMTHGAWYIPYYNNNKDEYRIKQDEYAGSLSYCPECKNVYDSMQYVMVVDGKKINTRKFYFYHDFPNLVKESKYKTCFKCMGKPCKIVERK